MTTENRMTRAMRIVTLRELASTGYWVPCDKSGSNTDEEEADHVRSTLDGKVYKWNQQKRISEHEKIAKRDEVHRNEAQDSDMVELSQLIDRVYDVLDRLERVQRKTG